MDRFSITWVTPFSVLLLLSGAGLSQAIVDESRETSFIYVDGVQGSDSNPGTSDRPLKTIGASVVIAENNNLQGIGTRVTINPATYREVIVISGHGNQTDFPMTFQAAMPGTVFISGAVPYTNWTAETQNPSIFTNIWPNQWGFCPGDGGGAPLEQPIVERREMIFVNSARMEQVLNLSELTFPGMFFVDEASGLVYLWPPAGTNMNTADVEVASVPTLLTMGGANASLNGVVFRGLTFEYANSCHGQWAVDIAGSNNTLIDTDAFVWNNAAGLRFNSAANVTVKNSIANHNGSVGFDSFQLLNSSFLNDEASYNNWRGAQGAYYYWASAGFHFFSAHQSTETGLKAIYNQSYAIHWDTDNQNITASSLFSANNIYGIFQEKNEGPLKLTGSLFCNSAPLSLGQGFIVMNSENTTFSGNTVFGNDNSQLSIIGIPGGFAVTNWETGEHYNLVDRNLTYTQNTIIGGKNQFVLKSTLTGSDWNTFVSTLTSDHNTWWNPTGTQEYLLAVPAVGTLLDFGHWQSTTGQDTNSVFQAPQGDPGAACAVTPDAQNFWVISDAGQLTTDIGGHAVFHLTSVAVKGFSGNITLTSGPIGAPGAKVNFTPALVAGSGTSTLLFSAGMHTPPGTYTFDVIANSGNITRTIALSVVVPVYQIWVAPTTLNFSNVPVGTTSNPQTVTLTNLQSSPLSIGAITTQKEFPESDNCGSSLAAGANCAIQVAFAPLQVGISKSPLTINDSAGTSPQTVRMTGSSVGSAKATLTPIDLYFNGEVIGSTTASQSLTLTNTGTAAMSIASIAFIGADPQDFSQTNTCQATLAVQTSCTITVAFTPTALGSRSATLSVADNALNSPQQTPVFGSGSTAVSVTPSFLAFGKVTVGHTSPPKTVTIKNLSTAPLPISSIRTSGRNAAEFQQTNTCGSGLAGLASCTVSVTFKPSGKNSRTATLTINDLDPTSPQSVSLQGGGG